MSIKKIYIQSIIVIAVFAVSHNLFSEQVEKKEYTPNSINLGITLNENFYLSNFITLQGIPSCCQYDNINHKFANGLGFSVYAGYSRELSNFIFNKDFKFFTNIMYSNISAEYSKETIIGNWIDNNNIDELLVKYIFDVSLSSVTLTPGMSFYIANKIKFPLSLDLGLNLGFLLKDNFIQKEELLNPPPAYFENGLKTRSNINGTLPNKSNIFFGLTLGVSYDLYKIGDYTISPKFTLNYGLTNIISDVDWKVSSANLGVNIAYNIPKKNEPVPEPPILPKLPKLSLPTIEELDLVVNASKPDNSKISIPVVYDEIINTTSILPIIYFKHYSDKFVEDVSISKIMYELKKANKLKIDIGISAKETETLFEQRQKAITELLNSNGINTSKIHFTKINAVKPEKYSQTDEENAYAKFIIDEQFKQIESRKRDTIVNSIGTNNVVFDTKITTTLPYSYELEYSIDNVNSEKTNTEHFDLLVDKNKLNWNGNSDNKTLNVQCKVNDNSGKYKAQSFTYQIVPNITVNSYFNSTPNNNYEKEYTIGFFAFDEIELQAINANYINEIKTLLRENKKIEIFGTTDNLGTNNYNITLSNARAKAAISLIDPDNQYQDNIRIGHPANINKQFDYSTPYGRQQSRVAIIRIMN